MKLLLATRSEGKAREIRQILADVPELEVVLPDEVGLPEHPDEDGIEIHDTFEGNALAKARWFHDRSGLPTVADDSGLEVDALGGRPGVWSRRFAPEAWVAESQGSQDRANNRYLLHELEGMEDREARFVCVAALVTGPGEESMHRGQVEGVILPAPVGEGGFGYDPLFRETATGLHFGLASPEEKGRLSHRGRAFRALRAEMLREGNLP
jgi:XTP/dITP diphosphohydrolase